MVFEGHTRGETLRGKNDSASCATGQQEYCSFMSFKRGLTRDIWNGCLRNEAHRCCLGSRSGSRTRGRRPMRTRGLGRRAPRSRSDSRHLPNCSRERHRADSVRKRAKGGRWYHLLPAAIMRPQSCPADCIVPVLTLVVSFLTATTTHDKKTYLMALGQRSRHKINQRFATSTRQR